MILKKEVIEQLSKDLSLSFTGIEQDWDLEMANSKRIKEFLIFYKQNDLTIDKKVALMSLILSSYDDFLNENNLEIDDKWEEIKQILEIEKIIFVDLINYWELNNDIEKDNLYRITPLIRKII
jgi:hypothetical protein